MLRRSLLPARTFAYSFQTLRMASTKRIPAGTTDVLQDGQMKAIETGEKDQNVLLTRVKGKYYATAAKCSHYGAPLVKGVLNPNDGCITCPWHGARFSACSGDIEDAPGLDAIYSFPVEVEGDKLFINVDMDKVKENNRKPHYASSAKGPASSEKTGILIVGGGAAGNQAAQALRELDYPGAITIVSSEPHLPIDRTKLSKALIDDPSKVELRGASFFQERGIDVKLGKSVKSVDFNASKATLDDRTSISYETIILATGASPSRPPSIKGIDLENIFVLRTIEHTKQINAALAAKTQGDKKPKLVVIGSSFIGLELCVAARDKAEITVVGTDKAPFQPQLGVEVGTGLKKFHESKGVRFFLESGLDKFEPSSSDKGSVGTVLTTTGDRIEADIVVLGMGVKPRTDYLEGSGLELEKGSIKVDKHFKIEGVKQGNAYAVGDIALYIDGITEQRATVQHWNVASNAGRAVANNIAGSPHPFTKAAVFWSAQGKQLRYVGTSESTQWKDVHVDGDPADLNFTAAYAKDDRIVAVCTMDPSRDPTVAHASELLRLGLMPSFTEFKKGKRLLDIPLSDVSPPPAARV